MGNKLIGALKFGGKKNKNVSLVTEVYKELFEDELKELEESKHNQSTEQMIRNLRSWGSVKSKPKERG